jgi:hypothetical protein
LVYRLGYGLDDRGSIPVGGIMGFFLFVAASRPALWPTQPHTQWVTGALFAGVKRSKREADHSLPSSAEVKNVWSYVSTHPYVFVAWYLIKRRDVFTLTLPYLTSSIKVIYAVEILPDFLFSNLVTLLFCVIDQWYSTFFPPVPLETLFHSTLYPQSCWCIIQVIHNYI